MVKVYCGYCAKFFDSNKIEFLNIEEDFCGHDVLEFVCPLCGNPKKSRRYAF